MAWLTPPSGLAQTAIQLVESTPVTSPTLWSQLGDSSTHPTRKGVHAFTILARILHDPAFDDATIQGYSQVMEKYAEKLNMYADQWSLGLSQPNELGRKVEELQYTNVILYAASGWTQSKPFSADFFL
jgi:hypothetical protein